MRDALSYHWVIEFCTLIVTPALKVRAESVIVNAESAPGSIETAEGSYWRAAVHRQEPYAGNSAYWFRRVGAHPVFPALRERAAATGMDVGHRWDPFAFIELCERARRDPGSESEWKALEVQLAEGQLIFDFCAAPAPWGRR